MFGASDRICAAVCFAPQRSPCWPPRRTDSSLSGSPCASKHWPHRNGHASKTLGFGIATPVPQADMGQETAAGFMAACSEPQLY